MQTAPYRPFNLRRQSKLKATGRLAGVPLLSRLARELLYSVEAAWMDAREAPLGVEGGSCNPDPVSEPAEPVESILLRVCVPSWGPQNLSSLAAAQLDGTPSSHRDEV